MCEKLIPFDGEQYRAKKINIESPERQLTVNKAIRELETAFEMLGIGNWNLPKISIRFVESNDNIELGHVEVRGDRVEIVYDQRFADSATEALLIDQLRASGMEYPGMLKTLKHELAHIAMWSVTGMERQPATRLLDEGWASLIENTGQELPIEQAKKAVKKGLSEETDIYNRCLDFDKPVTFNEELNAAEYKVGQALLLWVYEKFGKDKMIELIQRSPSPEKRNDDLNEGGFDPAVLDEDVHTTASEYSELINDVSQGRVTADEAVRLAKEWEGRQFEVALIEVTGLQNMEEVRQEFKGWINE